MLISRLKNRSQKTKNTRSDDHDQKINDERQNEDTAPPPDPPAIVEETSSASISADQSAIIHPTSDNVQHVLAVIIHGTDRIKSKSYIVHPSIKVHIVSASTGEYSKKPNWRHPAAYSTETTDYILPLMTKPSEFYRKGLSSPVWEELLLFNQDFRYFVDSHHNLMLMFEMLDFKTMHDVQKRPVEDLATTPSTDTPTDAGWHCIAWGFLKFVSASGAPNIGKLRIQLFKPPSRIKPRDGKVPEVYNWWRSSRRKFSGTLFVTVKRIDTPGHLPAAGRSMFAVQKESSEMPTTSEPDADQETAIDSGGSIETISWSRLAGQPCKVPNQLWLSLSCGQGGCFRTEFSPDGRYLACAGIEHERSFPIYIYKFPQGRRKNVVYGHLALVYDLAWNSNSDMILSVAADSTARLWHIDSPQCAKILAHTSFVYCARFHLDNDDMVFTGAFDTRIRLWKLNIASNTAAEVIQEFDAHPSYVNSLCFSIDNRYLYSGDGVGTLRIWARNTSPEEQWMLVKEIREDFLANQPINCLKVHPDGKRLFIQIRNGSICVMELRTFGLRTHYRGLQTGNVHLRGDLTPCGTFYFAGEVDGAVIVWHVDSGKRVAAYERVLFGDYPVAAVCYHKFDHWIAFAVYGSRRSVLVFKHNPSEQELVEKPPEVKKSNTKDFDFDYSVSKLLEEHAILRRAEVPFYHKIERNKTASTTESAVVQKKSDAARLTLKKVTFKDHADLEDSGGRRLEHKPSLLEEIPIEKLKSEPEAQSEATIDESSTATAFLNGSIVPEKELPVATAAVPSVNDVDSVKVIGKVVAKYDYTAQNEEEISLRKGDTVNLVNDEDLWWVGFVAEGNKIGYFPSNYVDRVENALEEL